MFNTLPPSAPAAALLTLTQAAALLPRRPHVATLRRWARRGITGRDGSRLRLAHVRIGRHLYVTEDALRAFGEAIARADVAEFEREAN